MFKSPSELCDVVSILVNCNDDRTFLLLQESNSTNYWIPSKKVATNTSWKATARGLAKEVLSAEGGPEKVIWTYRICVPAVAPPIHHVVFHIPVTTTVKNNIKQPAKGKGKYAWVTDGTVNKTPYSDHLSSTEILDLIAAVLGKSPDKKSVPPEGGKTAAKVGPDTFSSLSEILESDVIVRTTDPPSGSSLSAYEQLVKGAEFAEKEQYKIFREFLMTSFPCLYMNQQVFGKFMQRLGWTPDCLEDLFRACDTVQRGALVYKDFLYFLSIIEPTTKHGGAPAEIRCRYIFRYYDKDGDGKMEYTDFLALIQTVKKLKKQPIDAAEVKKEAETNIKSMGGAPGSPIPVSNFLTWAGSLKFRGTSLLLRSQKSVLDVLKDSPDDNKATPTAGGGPESTKMTAPSKKQDPSTYEVAVHTFTLNPLGEVCEMEQIWNLEPALSQSSKFMQKMTATRSRIKSLESFSNVTHTMAVLRGLRFFCTESIATGSKGKLVKPAYSWGEADPTGFADCVLQTCLKAIEILKEEPRLLQLDPPIYILGDLHGNYPDLHYFEKVFWHNGPTLSPSSMLFLGDYVDRGPHSVEVISYLIANKVQNPDKVKLLRGNHEVRTVQKMFTFYKECVVKFGDKLGNEVWERINDVFDHLPLAAVVDGKIFCCHGGIPAPWACPGINAINALPTPLTNPNESELAWQLMWNDPIRIQKMTKELQMELQAGQGFAHNARRGAGQVFTSDALKMFLTANGLTHVVRAHEVQKAGFQVQLKGMLITVFSSSRYGGGHNEAACVFAEQNKLRLFRLQIQ